jgi:Asp/Glu/hydantoin racemase
MARKRILVINPNSSESMTDSLDQLISNLNQRLPFSAEIHTYTAPSGPPSINNETDAQTSARVVLLDLETELSQYDAFLVACYSVHPLVGMLREKLAPHLHVTGIFEASISTALSLLPLQFGETRSRLGIVSTGTYWENALSGGVKMFLGLEDPRSSARFKGVETTGLNAIELHTAPPEEVRRKMMEATKRLVRDRDVKVICLGCAGMAGLDGIVEEALVEELGEEEARYVHVLDGVKAGLGLLEGLLRALPGKER